MRNGLNGVVYDDYGNEYRVSEAYARLGHPYYVYQQDRRGTWRRYYKADRGRKVVFRSDGPMTPDFALDNQEVS